MAPAATANDERRRPSASVTVVVSISADMGVIPFGRCRRLAPVTPRSRRSRRERIGRRAASGRRRAARVARRVAPTSALRRRRHRLRVVPPAVGLRLRSRHAEPPEPRLVVADRRERRVGRRTPRVGVARSGPAGRRHGSVVRGRYLARHALAVARCAARRRCCSGAGPDGVAVRERRATGSDADRARHDRLPAVTAGERVGGPRPAGRDRDLRPLAPAQRHLRARVAATPLVVRGDSSGVATLVADARRRTLGASPSWIRRRTPGRRRRPSARRWRPRRSR